MDIVLGEPFAGALDPRPVLHFERDVVELRDLVEDEVDGVVIRPATQEREGVAMPIRHPKPEHVGIEFHHPLHVVHAIGHVPELERHDARLHRILAGEEYSEKTSIKVSFGSLKTMASATPGEMPLRRSLLTPCLASSRVTSARSLPGAT